MSTRDFVLKINSMTQLELHKEFPDDFIRLSSNDDPSTTVNKMLANDAIKWRLVKEFAQKESTN